MPWVSSGRITNPTLDQVLVDTGQLPAGGRSFNAVASASVVGIFEVQLRDATNTTTLKSQILCVPANGTANIPEAAANCNFDMAANERIRIIQAVALTGISSCSLFYSP